MKTYFTIFLFCCFWFRMFAQTVPNSTCQQSFTIENTKFNSAGVILEGNIFKPKNIVASVVIVHGSGQEIRMTEIAILLAKNGIAVLTYDKRGVGKSGGIYAGPEVGTNNIDSANLNLLALDASAATNALLAKLPAKHWGNGLNRF